MRNLLKAAAHGLKSTFDKPARAARIIHWQVAVTNNRPRSRLTSKKLKGS